MKIEKLVSLEFQPLVKQNDMVLCCIVASLTTICKLVIYTMVQVRVCLGCFWGPIVNRGKRFATREVPPS